MLCRVAHACRCIARFVRLASSEAVGDCGGSRCRIGRRRRRSSTSERGCTRGVLVCQLRRRGSRGRVARLELFSVRRSRVILARLQLRRARIGVRPISGVVVCLLRGWRRSLPSCRSGCVGRLEHIRLDISAVLLWLEGALVHSLPNSRRLLLRSRTTARRRGWRCCLLLSDLGPQSCVAVGLVAIRLCVDFGPFEAAWPAVCCRATNDGAIAACARARP